MASVRHPNVISYLGLCTEPACIVTEYCSKGSLTDVGPPRSPCLPEVAHLHVDMCTSKRNAEDPDDMF